MSRGARIYDISRPLSSRTAPWPGDTPFSLEWTVALARGESCNVSRWALSPHVGTHVDAPLHYQAGGATPADLSLDIFIGPARVVDACGCAALDGALFQRLVPEPSARLLVRTQQEVDPAVFSERFPALAPDGARWLVEQRAKVFGTDAPSVDPIGSKDLEAHKILGAAGVAILENLDLSRVPPGVYELVALPLRVEGADASPVRAILVEMAS